MGNQVQIVTVSIDELRDMIDRTIGGCLTQYRVEPVRLIYTKEQAMELFGKSESCIDKWIRDGKLRLVKMGGASYIPGSCVAEWLASYEKR